MEHLMVDAWNAMSGVITDVPAVAWMAVIFAFVYGALSDPKNWIISGFAQSARFLAVILVITYVADLVGILALPTPHK
jgi:hypothetical protein